MIAGENGIMGYIVIHGVIFEKKDISWEV